jgi:hypothetical protein
MALNDLKLFIPGYDGELHITVNDFLNCFTFSSQEDDTPEPPADLDFGLPDVIDYRVGNAGPRLYDNYMTMQELEFGLANVANRTPVYTLDLLQDNVISMKNGKLSLDINGNFSFINQDPVAPDSAMGIFLKQYHTLIGLKKWHKFEDIDEALIRSFELYAGELMTKVLTGNQPNEDDNVYLTVEWNVNQMAGNKQFALSEDTVRNLLGQVNMPFFRILLPSQNGNDEAENETRRTVFKMLVLNAMMDVAKTTYEYGEDIPGIETKIKDIVAYKKEFPHYDAIANEIVAGTQQNIQVKDRLFWAMWLIMTARTILLNEDAETDNEDSEED